MTETVWIMMWLPLVVMGLFVLKWLLKRVNVWIYESKLGEKRHYLPPGDLGWPFIGNMLPFLRAFKTSDPDSFIRTYITRYLLLLHILIVRLKLRLFFLSCFSILTKTCLCLLNDAGMDITVFIKYTCLGTQV